MRNMSFALTTAQVRNQTKTVTRRLGWTRLKAGDHIQPVVKGMGLRKGESPEKIGGPITVVDVRRERLCDITPAECVLEGFPEMTPAQFVQMFRASHRVPAGGPGQFAAGGRRLRSVPCEPDEEVTRIEFAYVEPPR